MNKNNVFAKSRAEQSCKMEPWSPKVGLGGAERTKLKGKLETRAVQDGPKSSYEGPRWPPKGSQVYNHWVLSMIGAHLGGPSGAILGDLRASGAGLGALGLDLGVWGGLS